MRPTLAVLFTLAALTSGSRSDAAAPVAVWHPASVAASAVAGRSGAPLAAEAGRSASPLAAESLNPSGWAVEGNANFRKLGSSAVTAGDVNADGYSDVLVSAEGGSSGTSWVYLYLGGPGGLSTAPSWSRTGFTQGPKLAPLGDVNGDGYGDFVIGYGNIGSPGNGFVQVWYGRSNGNPNTFFTVSSSAGPFGFSVGSAGDVNGDGYDDVVVGNPSGSCNGTGSGGFSLYFGAPAGLTTGNSASYCVFGLAANAHLGWSVGTAGDVNGDGYDDVIAGAPDYDTGRAYIYLGSSTGLGGTFTPPDVTLIGPEPNGRFGYSVSTAGDANGDGYSDVVIGAPSVDSGTILDMGMAYAYAGGASLAMPWLWQIGGCCTNNQFGATVAPAGDLDGDGYADFVVSGPGVNGGAVASGAVWVQFGGSTVIYTNALEIDGTQTNEAFGSGVGTAGDTDGDGFSDLIVGGPGWTNPENTEGHVVLYRGGADGPQLTALWTTFGSQLQQNVGWSVAAAGDVNGDGYADTIVGCPGYDASEFDQDLGFAYIFLGSALGLDASYSWIAFGDVSSGSQGLSVAGAGDVNGDGYEDVLVGQPGVAKAKLFYGAAGAMSATPAWTGSGKTGSLYGWSVAGAGDVNRDGYADFLVGAPTDDGGGAGAGRAQLYLGGPGGPSTTPSQVFIGTQIGEQLGEAVAGVGDINGDGHSDIAIGAPQYDAPGHGGGLVDAGRVLVYLGDLVNVHETPDFVLVAAGNDRFGSRIAGPGDVNGDGFSDVAIGAPYFTSSLVHAGQVKVFLGSASGLATTSGWTINGDETEGQLGWMASSAGDVNADGASDLLVGSYVLGASDAGRAFVYSGLGSTIPFWTRNGDLPGDWFGFAGAGVGDVNGDGFGDLAISAIAADIVSGDDGRVSQFLGNLRDGDYGLDRFTLIRRSLATTTPVAPQGTTDQTDRVRLSAKGRTAAGTGVLGLDYRLTPTTGGGPVLKGQVGTWVQVLPGAGGASGMIGDLQTGLAPNKDYALQLRVRAPHKPYFPWTPWLSPALGGRAMMDFRTKAATNAVALGGGAPGVMFAAPSPNPSHEMTGLEFSIPSRGQVRLAVYDLAGREIVRLADGSFAAGMHRTEWRGVDQKGRAVGAGIYFAKLETGGSTKVQRLVRLK